MPAERIGQILIGRRLLEPQQVAQLMDVQARDPRPLGQIASEYFGVEREKVCEALAEQLLDDCPRTNMVHETLDPHCLMMVRADEAWSNLVLPMRVEDGVLLCAATAETLDRAIQLMQTRTATPYRFLIVPIRQIEQYICQLYEYEGLDVA